MYPNKLINRIFRSIFTIIIVTVLSLGTAFSQDEEKDKIAEVSKTAREVVDDLRDAVWMVDAENDDLASLVTRMKQITTTMLKGIQSHFDKLSEVPAIPLEMEQRRNLFLIYREMIHNVMRHAQASLVEIEIKYDVNLFCIKIEDNGIGFDRKNVTRGRGLTSLRTRAKMLKGTVRIESTPGEGTIQEFSFKIV